MSTENLPGSDLVADLDQYEGIHRGHFAYWMGVIPTCPVPYITCAGFAFSKVNELLIPDMSLMGEKQRVPVIGSMHKSVTKAMIDKVKLALPQLVVRFTEPPRDEETSFESGSQGVVDATVLPRKGFVITIPTKKQIEEGEEVGQTLPRYIRQEWDEPAAKYMFMQPCVDQDNPQRGGSYPQTLDKTGLDIASYGDIEGLLN